MSGLTACLELDLVTGLTPFWDLAVLPTGMNPFTILVAGCAWFPAVGLASACEVAARLGTRVGGLDLDLGGGARTGSVLEGQATSQVDGLLTAVRCCNRFLSSSGSERAC